MLKTGKGESYSSSFCDEKMNVGNIHVNECM